MLKLKCIKPPTKMVQRQAFSHQLPPRLQMVLPMTMGLKILAAPLRVALAQRPILIKRAFRSLTQDRTTMPSSSTYLWDLEKIKSRGTFITRICRPPKHSRTKESSEMVQALVRRPRTLGRLSSLIRGAVMSTALLPSTQQAVIPAESQEFTLVANKISKLQIKVSF